MGREVWRIWEDTGVGERTGSRYEHIFKEKGNFQVFFRTDTCIGYNKIKAISDSIVCCTSPHHSWPWPSRPPECDFALGIGSLRM